LKSKISKKVWRDNKLLRGALRRYTEEYHLATTIQKNCCKIRISLIYLHQIKKEKNYE